MSDTRSGFDTNQMRPQILPSASEMTALSKQPMPYDGNPSADRRNHDVSLVVKPDIAEVGEEIEGETVAEFLARRIQRCRRIASGFAESKRLTDQLAREVLVEVAATAFSSRFDVAEACRILGCKISKSILRNPCTFLIRQIYPDRDPKVVSKQSIALGYALQQCDFDIDKLRDYFKNTSIKQCLRDYRSAKAGEREGKAPTEDGRLVLRGLPEGLSGEVVVRIDIRGATARFVCLFEGVNPDAISQAA